jgi:hypothetical protein
VVQAGQQALAQVQTNQRFLHPTQQRYVAKLLATFPPELNTVYLCNSGEVSGVVAGLVSAGQCNTMVVMLRVCFEDGLTVSLIMWDVQVRRRMTWHYVSLAPTLDLLRSIRRM